MEAAAILGLGVMENDIDALPFSLRRRCRWRSANAGSEPGRPQRLSRHHR